MAKSTKERTALEAQTVLKATAFRLTQASLGDLTLAPEVRITLANVVQLLWKLRRSALARQRELVSARKAADAAAAFSPTDAELAAELDAVFGNLHAAAGSAAVAADA